MAEIEGMTDEQLQAALREMDSQIRRERNEYTNNKKQTDDLLRRVKDNREKLKDIKRKRCELISSALRHGLRQVGD